MITTSATPILKALAWNGSSVTSAASAWSSLSARVKTLKEAFGQLISSAVAEVASLWASLRRAQDSVPKMLCFLSEPHRISLWQLPLPATASLNLQGSLARWQSHTTLFLPASPRMEKLSAV